MTSSYDKVRWPSASNSLTVVFKEIATQLGPKIAKIRYEIDEIRTEATLRTMLFGIW
jgi:hypothetical protein